MDFPPWNEEQFREVIEGLFLLGENRQNAPDINTPPLVSQVHSKSFILSQ